MRALSLDIGSKRIGVAISNLEQTVISPLSQIQCEKFNGKELFISLQKLLVSSWDEINTLVLGKPININGQVNLEVASCISQVQKVFKTWTNWTIVFVDENYSSVWSNEILNNLNYSRANKKLLQDSFASLKILQYYFDQQNKPTILTFK